MIQDKFPGLRRLLSWLSDTERTELLWDCDKDLSKLSFVDRINLHFKLGNLSLVIPFTDEEMVYVSACWWGWHIWQGVCGLQDDCPITSTPSPGRTITILTTGDGNSDGGDWRGVIFTESEKDDQEQERGWGATGCWDTINLDQEGGTSGSETQSETRWEHDKNLGCVTSTMVTAPVTLKLPVVSWMFTHLSSFVMSSMTLLNQKPPVVWSVCNESSQFLSSIKRDVTFMVHSLRWRKSAWRLRQDTDTQDWCSWHSTTL